MARTDLSSSQFAMVMGTSAVLFFLALLPLELIPEIPVDIDMKPFFIPLILVALLPVGRATLAVGLGVALGEGLRDLMEGYELDDPFGFVGYIVAFVIAGYVIAARPLNRALLALGAIVCGGVQAAFEAGTFLLFGEESVPVALTSLLGNTLTHGVLWGALPLMYFAPRLHGRFERYLNFAPKGLRDDYPRLKPGASYDGTFEPHALVDVRGLTFRYPAEAKPALRDVWLSIRAGECLGLIGPSGAGKSTACAVLAGLAQRMTGGDLAGVARVGDFDLLGGHTDDLARHVVLVTGEPAAQLTQARALDEVACVLINRGSAPTDARRRGAELLEQLGLPASRHATYSWELGESDQRRITLAAALAADPQLLILDEVAVGFDALTRRRLCALIREQSAHRALIWVDTDPDWLLECADRVAVLADGRTLALGPAEQVLADETVLRRAHLQRPWHLLTPAPAAPDTHARTVPRSGAARSEAQPARLQVVNLTFAYGDTSAQLDELNLSVAAGEVHAVLGANGAGKTALARLLAGLERPQHGQILLDGQPIEQDAVRQRLGRIGLVMTHPDPSLSERRVDDELRVPLRRLGLSSADITQRMEAVLDTGLLPRTLLASDPTLLPFALRKRVQIAIALATGPAVLILDEPATGLDTEEKQWLACWLRRLAERGTAVLLLDHDADLIAEAADRVALLAGGRIIAEGPPAALFAEARWGQLHDLGLMPPRSARAARTLGLPDERPSALRARLAA